MAENKKNESKRVYIQQPLLMLGTARGKQTFESSRMPAALRKQMRDSFKKASQPDQ